MLTPVIYQSTLNGAPVFIAEHEGHWYVRDRKFGDAWWLSGYGWKYLHLSHPEGDHVDVTTLDDGDLTVRFATPEAGEAFIREFESRYPETAANVERLMAQYFRYSEQRFDRDADETRQWLLCHPDVVAHIELLLAEMAENEDRIDRRSEFKFRLVSDEGDLVVRVRLPQDRDDRLVELAYECAMMREDWWRADDEEE